MRTMPPYTPLTMAQAERRAAIILGRYEQLPTSLPIYLPENLCSALSQAGLADAVSEVLRQGLARLNGGFAPDLAAVIMNVQASAMLKLEPIEPAA